MMVRVGLVGLGAIGRGLCSLIAADPEPSIRVVGALVRTASDGQRRPSPVLTTATLVTLLSWEPELVVEAAGHDALRAYGPAILRSGSDLVVFSVGALADEATRDELLRAAAEGGSTIEIGTGAVGGLDLIAAAARGGLDRVVHTTIKPARSLLGDGGASELSGPTEIYRGAARQAVTAFPQNVNVMAAVSLAGIGFDRTEVSIVADPDARANRHIIEAQGTFGSFRAEIESIPSDDNPKTGRLVAMSAYQTIIRRRATLRIG